jgi:hypothetical protein
MRLMKKFGEFLDQLSEFQLLKKNLAARKIYMIYKSALIDANITAVTLVILMTWS